MFSNRFTAIVDACSLADVLRRNLLLTLAEAGFFRLRWSRQILDETEEAIRRILVHKGVEVADTHAERARRAMERAFEDAAVEDFDGFLCMCANLPDAGDAHVVAAALKTQAAVIVTENLKHFPSSVLKPLNVEVLSADVFIADTIALAPGRAVAAVRMMRTRFKTPKLTADDLLTRMESRGLIEAVDLLRPYRESL
ncbi:MAG: PIN domain-containing protein [Janthinobacterium lividum]